MFRHLIFMIIFIISYLSFAKAYEQDLSIKKATIHPSILNPFLNYSLKNKGNISSSDGGIVFKIPYDGKGSYGRFDHHCKFIIEPSGLESILRLKNPSQFNMVNYSISVTIAEIEFQSLHSKFKIECSVGSNKYPVQLYLVKNSFLLYGINID